MHAVEPNWTWSEKKRGTKATLIGPIIIRKIQVLSLYLKAPTLPGSCGRTSVVPLFRINTRPGYQTISLPV